MIDMNTPSHEYAPLRDLSNKYCVLNPDDIDIPAVFKHQGYFNNQVALWHETFKENEYMLVYQSDILRDATDDEIVTDIPNYNF